MWKFSIAAALALGLLTAAGLMLPDSAHAQGAQHNESDLDFSRRMMARVNNIEAQAERLKSVIDYRETGRIDSSMRQHPNSSSQNQMQTGRERRTTGYGGDTRQMQFKLKTVQNNAKKARKKLESVRGSKAKDEPLNHKKIESSVKRMERDLADLDRELRRR